MGKILAFLTAIFDAIRSIFPGGSATIGGTVPGPQVGASPKGIGNKNPFNLEFRTAIEWRGQIGSDGRFVIFDTALNGLRAGMINIHTKMTRDGLNTVRKIITRLSPAVENPTEAFIQFVSGKMGVAPDQPLQFGSHILAMSEAIIQFENGEQPYPNTLLLQALRETGKV